MEQGIIDLIVQLIVAVLAIIIPASGIKLHQYKSYIDKAQAINGQVNKTLELVSEAVEDSKITPDELKRIAKQIKCVKSSLDCGNKGLGL